MLPAMTRTHAFASALCLIAFVFGALTDHHFTAEAVNTWTLPSGKAAAARITGPARLEELPGGGMRITSAWPIEIGDAPVAVVASGS